MFTLFNMTSFKVPWYAIFLLIPNVICTGLYFSMDNLKITIPKLQNSSYGKSLILAKIMALPEEKCPDGNISYTLADSHLFKISSHNGLLTIYSDTQFNEKQFSKIQLTDESLFSMESTRYVVKVKAKLKTNLNRRACTGETKVEIYVVENCDLLSKEMCFWNSATYQIYENHNPKTLGSLTSPYFVQVCEEYNVSYTVLNGTDLISIHPTSNENIWKVATKLPLDRDIERDVHLAANQETSFVQGSKLYFNVQCTITFPVGTKRYLVQTIKFSVLDENDNVPLPQISDQTYDILINNTDTDSSIKEKLEKISKYLILIDKDSHQVNNYTVKLLNDYKNIFIIKYNTWKDERFDEHQTPLHIKLSIRNNSKHLIPKPSYIVVVQINDTTMLPEFGDSTTNITIRLLTETSTGNYETVRRINNSIYPETVTIYRTASPLARVCQPINLQDITRSTIFKIVTNSAEKIINSGPFDVTNPEGIVYIKNNAVLRALSSPIKLNIAWTNNATTKVHTDTIHIFLEYESTKICANLSYSPIESWEFCSNIKTQKECNQICGIGTGGKSSVDRINHDGATRCVWRGEKNPSTVSTKLFSTCTPDSLTCPDYKCDALEQLHLLICPQDCTESVWHGDINKQSKQGISKGRGICKCDIFGKCYCNVTPHSTNNSIVLIKPINSNAEVYSENRLENIKITNISRQTGSEDTLVANCGVGCIIIGICVTSLFLLLALTGTIAIWKNCFRVKKKNRKQKLFPAWNILQPPISGQSETALNGDTENPLELHFRMNTAVNPNYDTPKPMPEVDAKWEFARENLLFEEILGEGEFGRVLRARALEICGLPGLTVVAVKTLKEDAREVERKDLLSEYELLKNVSHPNVIKLFGASTIPPGPIYLIMEFAEHGSLRNYLRRCRHVKTDPNLSKGNTYKITSKEVLSFAWQISKGMTYLDDIKLVHRDLAARNILVAAGMVCKISDFGLTRDVYEDDTYFKKTKSRVPVKWMAPESLGDNIYSSKSDVWSFGILLWELVSLGSSPYPGISVQKLFYLLRSGYRMEKPDNCSQLLYKIMVSCWNQDPNKRPVFKALMEKFESMLSDGIEYLDLSVKAVHNRTYDELSDTSPNILNDEETDLLNAEENPQIEKYNPLWNFPNISPAENAVLPKASNINEEFLNYECPITFTKENTEVKAQPESYIDMTSTDTEMTLKKEKYEKIEYTTNVTSL